MAASNAHTTQRVHPAGKLPQGATLVSAQTHRQRPNLCSQTQGAHGAMAIHSCCHHTARQPDGLTTAGQTVAAGHKAPLCLSQLHSTFSTSAREKGGAHRTSQQNGAALLWWHWRCSRWRGDCLGRLGCLGRWLSTSGGGPCAGRRNGRGRLGGFVNRQARAQGSKEVRLSTGLLQHRILHSQQQLLMIQLTKTHHAQEALGLLSTESCVGLRGFLHLLRALGTLGTLSSFGRGSHGRRGRVLGRCFTEGILVANGH
mmetsp:Transcript_39436/g.85060  ORF Transcript_39436/g.85060 Transcript_39436/m.85060 type:complete len:257 (+) Transcript_39436:93-863(+)